MRFPTRWKLVPLCDVLASKLLNGPHQNGMEFGNGNPIVRMVDLYRGDQIDVASLDRVTYPRGLDEQYRLCPSDILLNRTSVKRDGIGKAAIVDRVSEPTYFDCSIIRARPDTTIINSRYLLRALNGPCCRPQVLGRCKTATITTITQPDVELIEIPLPPLAEQQRIAEVLDRAEALRVKRRAALAQLDSFTQSLFLDLFGDPVSNPKKWPDPTLGGLLAFQQYGPRFYNESYSAEGIRIVRITDLSEEGVLDFSSMPRLLVSDEDREKYVLRPGDLIFARTGATVGKVALIQSNDPPCIAGAYFITMRFKDSLVPIYARAVLTAPSVRAIVAKRSRQAAQQNFSGPGLRQLPMPLPPIELQREFARRVQAMEKLKTTQRASLAELDALFASLQYRAFRGEL